jgi:uncharacterized oligopeptide transporter (OPT) family protein
MRENAYKRKPELMESGLIAGDGIYSFFAALVKAFC